jgi:hypothetical protein
MGTMDALFGSHRHLNLVKLMVGFGLGWWGGGLWEKPGRR